MTILARKIFLRQKVEATGALRTLGAELAMNIKLPRYAAPL